MKVRFCGACRRLILADFRFCPYCGENLGHGPGLPELLEEPFVRLDRASFRMRVGDRIDELNARLDLIDAEMEILLAARNDN